MIVSEKGERPENAGTLPLHPALPAFLFCRQKRKPHIVLLGDSRGPSAGSLLDHYQIRKRGSTENGEKDSCSESLREKYERNNG